MIGEAVRVARELEEGAKAQERVDGDGLSTRRRLE